MFDNRFPSVAGCIKDFSSPLPEAPTLSYDVFELVCIFKLYFNKI